MTCRTFTQLLHSSVAHSSVQVGLVYILRQTYRRAHFCIPDSDLVSQSFSKVKIGMSHENYPDPVLSQSSGYSSTDVSGTSAGSGSKLPLPPYKPVPSLAESSWTSDKRSVNVHHHYTYHGCQFQYTSGGLSTDEVGY